MNPYWLAPAVAIAVPLILGPLGAWSGMLRPDTGLFLVGMAVFLALAACIALGGAAAYATVNARAWRRSALRAAILPLAVVAASIAFLREKGSAAINDVSTDLSDRPPFSADPPLEPLDARALEARLEDFAARQREAYPELAPLVLAAPPAEAFARARAAAARMSGWVLTREDPAALELEASATTPVFRFVDDVSIRVRAAGTGSRIDVRSRSRLGRADFGANAARIRAFMSEIRPTGA
jgi:uncharacterized protein (DUF1499 family)